MTTAMDSRTRQYLIDVGVITRRGLTRKPQHRKCPIGCGQVLLAAQDMGHELWCDRHPLTALGELAAVLAGRATYTHAAGELDHRDAMRIAYRSADVDEVYAEHRCGSPPLPSRQAGTGPPKPAAATHPDNPPF